MYIVQSGELVIQKDISFPVYSDKPPQVQDFCQSNKFSLEKADKYRSDVVKLKIVGYAQLIGEQDILFNNKYRTTAKCLTQTASLYRITKKNMFKYLDAGSGQNLKLFQDAANEKVEEFCRTTLSFIRQNNNMGTQTLMALVQENQ